MEDIKWEAKNLFENWIIIDQKDNVVNIRENEKIAKLMASAPDLLKALEHTLDVLYKCDCPPELHEEYGNLFMNYNNLVSELKFNPK